MTVLANVPRTMMCFRNASEVLQLSAVPATHGTPTLVPTTGSGGGGVVEQLFIESYRELKRGR